MTIHAIRIGFSLAALSLLAACSGGSGDGGPSTFGGFNPPPTSQLVTITESNAPAIAGVAAEQIIEDSLISTLTTTGIPVVGAGSFAASDMVRLSGSSPVPGTAAATLPTQDCAVSGTVDITFDVNNPETISLGDEFAFEFDACNDGAGATISGGLGMTVTGFNGDPGSDQFFLQLRLELSAFTVTQDGMTAGAEGIVNISIDSRQPPVTTVSVSSSAFTVTNGGMSETVFDLDITIVEDQSVFPTAVSVDTSFRLSSPRLGGDIIVATSIALQSFGEEYPYDGEFTITGSANGSVTVIALGGDSVRLEIDLDGDGSPDVTVDTTWTEVMAQADAA